MEQEKQNTLSQEELNQLKLQAEQGDAEAQYNLGVCYIEGYGTEQNTEKAVYWWMKAAEQGDANAQYNLALSYEYGFGVEQSYEHAVYWFQKAAEQGLEEASAELDNINEQIMHIGELEQLGIPFEEAERIFLDVVEKAIAEKKHIRNKEVKLSFVAADSAVELALYKEEYAKGGCFREKAMFHFYIYMLREYVITEWRNVLYKTLQCMRACPELFVEDYMQYHYVAQIYYQANGDDTRAKRHLYCQLMKRADIADEEYLMELIKESEAPSDENKALLLTIFYYALIRSDWSEDDEYDWSRERHTLIEQALKEATTHYAESEECSLLQRALIYLCREIYYRKTRRAKLAEKANTRLFELLDALAPEGIDEDNFLENALQTIENDLQENLLPPFISAVENTFADLIEEEGE